MYIISAKLILESNPALSIAFFFLNFDFTDLPYVRFELERFGEWFVFQSLETGGT